MRSGPAAPHASSCGVLELRQGHTLQGSRWIRREGSSMWQTTEAAAFPHTPSSLPSERSSPWLVPPFLPARAHGTSRSTRRGGSSSFPTLRTALFRHIRWTSVPARSVRSAARHFRPASAPGATRVSPSPPRRAWTRRPSPRGWGGRGSSWRCPREAVPQSAQGEARG
jgi:hypothetical protein